MLVCGVLQTASVRHVGDAMVVGNAEHVVPMFYGECLNNDIGNVACGSRRQSQVPVVASKLQRSQGKPTSGVASAASNAKEEKKVDKNSKFKARLAKRSKGH